MAREPGTHLPRRRRARVPEGHSADIVRAPRDRGAAGWAARASPPLRSFPRAREGRGLGWRGGAAHERPLPEPRRRCPRQLAAPAQRFPTWDGVGHPRPLPPPPPSAPHLVLPAPVRDHAGSRAPGRACSSACLKPSVLSGGTHPAPPHAGAEVKTGSGAGPASGVGGACGGRGPQPGGRRGDQGGRAEQTAGGAGPHRR